MHPPCLGGPGGRAVSGPVELKPAPGADSSHVRTPRLAGAPPSRGVVTTGWQRGHGFLVEGPGAVVTAEPQIASVPFDGDIHAAVVHGDRRVARNCSWHRSGSLGGALARHGCSLCS